MKVKVMKGFLDKHTNKPHEFGDEFECTEERLAEIMKEDKGLVVKVAEPTATKKKLEEKE